MQWLLVGAGLMVGVSAALGFLGYRGRQQVVGIDLGTTFSVVAVKAGPEVSILPDIYSGKPLVPSVVTFHPNGTTVVGSRAVKLRGELPQHTVFNAKRFIGRPYSECHEDAASHPFTTVANPADGSDESLAGFRIPSPAGGLDRWVSPIAVGAAVVRHLGLSIHKHMGYKMTKAVICVPAKFSWRERKATTDAFEAAGFKVMRVLEEPTAAAIAYNLHKGSGSKYVLVYDIGGGTLDTSLLFMNGKSASVLGVAGDDHLGGSDFDLRTRELLRQRLPEAPSLPKEGAEEPELACDDAGLLMLGEEAKIALSSADEAEVRCLGEDGNIRRLVVTRTEFEEASRDLFARSMAPVGEVLKDQMMTGDNVDDVVLVGGSSRIPKLRELLQEFIGPDKRLHTEIDPDVTVAYGAANILD